MAGETTSVAASAARGPYYVGAGAFWIHYNLTFGSTDNETSDVMEAGYVPANVRVVQVNWHPTDMDTNVSPAVVHKVTINSVDAVTGLTGAQSGTSSVNAVTSTFAATAPGTSLQLVKVTTSTAAGTGAAGTAVLSLLCQAL